MTTRIALILFVLLGLAAPTLATEGETVTPEDLDAARQRNAEVSAGLEATNIRYEAAVAQEIVIRESLHGLASRVTETEQELAILRVGAEAVVRETYMTAGSDGGVTTILGSTSFVDIPVRATYLSAANDRDLRVIDEMLAVEAEYRAQVQELDDALVMQKDLVAEIEVLAQQLLAELDAANAEYRELEATWQRQEEERRQREEEERRRREAEEAKKRAEAEAARAAAAAAASTTTTSATSEADTATTTTTTVAPTTTITAAPTTTTTTTVAASTTTTTAAESSESEPSSTTTTNTTEPAPTTTTTVPTPTSATSGVSRQWSIVLLGQLGGSSIRRQDTQGCGHVGIPRHTSRRDGERSYLSALEQLTRRHLDLPDRKLGRPLLLRPPGCLGRWPRRWAEGCGRRSGGHCGHHRELTVVGSTSPPGLEARQRRLGEPVPDGE